MNQRRLEVSFPRRGDEVIRYSIAGRLNVSLTGTQHPAGDWARRIARWAGRSRGRCSGACDRVPARSPPPGSFIASDQPWPDEERHLGCRSPRSCSMDPVPQSRLRTRCRRCGDGPPVFLELGAASGPSSCALADGDRHVSGGRCCRERSPRGDLCVDRNREVEDHLRVDEARPWVCRRRLDGP